MISKHIQLGWDAAVPAGVPLSSGDREYAQDLYRDINYLQDRLGLILKDLESQIPLLLSGGVVSQGTGATLNITEGYGYAAYQAQVVNSYASTPPTTVNEDIEAIRVAWTAQTNMALPSYTPGGATNYVKVRYSDSNSSQRTRAKKAGTYYYDQAPSYTFVVDTSAPTKYDLCLASFVEGAGVFTITPYIAHEGTYVIKNQTSFNNLFVRTGANAYDFNNNVKTVHIKAGTYLVSGILSGGDTWGDLFTNNCINIECETGAYFDFANLKGNLTVETDGCYVHNLHIKGNGSSAAIIESFKLNANYVTFDNCKCSNRLSSVDMVGFQGSGTALHNVTSKYINCSVYTLDSADKLYGFNDCKNLQNCLVYDLDTTTGSDICRGFYGCNNINNCTVYSLNSSTGAVEAFSTGYRISSCYAYGLNSTDAYAIGFSACFEISSCRAENISGKTTSYGFDGCNIISGSYAAGIASNTALACGFSSCNYLSSCMVGSVTSVLGTEEGFHSCAYGSSLYTAETTNGLNDWIDTVDANITNKVSTPSVWT